MYSTLYQTPFGTCPGEAPGTPKGRSGTAPPTPSATHGGTPPNPPPRRPGGLRPPPDATAEGHARGDGGRAAPTPADSPASATGRAAPSPPQGSGFGVRGSGPPWGGVVERPPQGHSPNLPSEGPNKERVDGAVRPIDPFPSLLLGSPAASTTQSASRAQGAPHR